MTAVVILSLLVFGMYCAMAIGDRVGTEQARRWRNER